MSTQEQTQETLELLEIRDAAEKNGGVEDDHIQKALCVADRVRRKMSSDLDDLVSCTTRAVSKAVGE